MQAQLVEILLSLHILNDITALRTFVVPVGRIAYASHVIVPEAHLVHSAETETVSNLSETYGHDYGGQVQYDFQSYLHLCPIANPITKQRVITIIRG